MLTLTTISSALAIVFFATSVILVWYIRQLFKRIVVLNENHKDLLAMLKHYSGHISSVYEMEMFYGDETLSNLINHSKDIIEEVNNFAALFPGIGEAPIGENIDVETQIEE